MIAGRSNGPEQEHDYDHEYEMGISVDIMSRHAPCQVAACGGSQIISNSIGVP